MVMRTSCGRCLQGAVWMEGGATRGRTTMPPFDGHQLTVMWTSWGRCSHGVVWMEGGVTRVRTTSTLFDGHQEAVMWTSWGRMRARQTITLSTRHRIEVMWTLCGCCLHGEVQVGNGVTSAERAMRVRVSFGRHATWRKELDASGHVCGLHGSRRLLAEIGRKKMHSSRTSEK